MESDVYVVILGLKIALSLALFVLAFALDAISKSKKKGHVHGLNIMAFALLVLALFEFFEDMASIYSGLPGWLSHDLVNSWVKLGALFVAGIGIIIYLVGIKKSIKYYY
jgi:multisubunit Na+/H+ antiporter MnhB subunit